MPKIAEKLGFLMRETVGVRQETIISRQNSLLLKFFTEKTFG
jgi:hypothetical protein